MGVAVRVDFLPATAPVDQGRRLYWLCIAVLSKGCSPRHHESAGLSPATVQKLKTISDEYQGSSNKADVAKLGTQIAREFSGDPGVSVTQRARCSRSLSRRPPAMRGREACGLHVRHGVREDFHVLSRTGGIAQGAADFRDLARPWIAVAPPIQATSSAAPSSVRGHAGAYRYDRLGGGGTVVWSNSYPAAGADPAKIAAEVDSKVPSLGEE